MVLQLRSILKVHVTKAITYAYFDTYNKMDFAASLILNISWYLYDIYSMVSVRSSPGFIIVVDSEKL
jgi:hypothetical protein